MDFYNKGNNLKPKTNLFPDRFNPSENKETKYNRVKFVITQYQKLTIAN